MRFDESHESEVVFSEIREIHEIGSLSVVPTVEQCVWEFDGWYTVGYLYFWDFGEKNLPSN